MRYIWTAFWALVYTITAIRILQFPQDPFQVFVLALLVSITSQLSFSFGALTWVITALPGGDSILGTSEEVRCRKVKFGINCIAHFVVQFYALWRIIGLVYFQ